MKLRDFVSLAQRGYQKNDYLQGALPGVFSTNPFMLADLIASFIKTHTANSSNLSIDFSQIKKVATEFHAKAGTLTEAVRKNIDRLGDSTPLLRIAHTPDHFGYLGVYLQFVFLNIAAEEVSKRVGVIPSQLLLLVDYESIQDKRLRQSYFPDIECGDGSLRLSTPVPHSIYYKSQNAIPKPERRVIEEWLSDLSTQIKHNLSILRRDGVILRDGSIFRERFKIIENEIWVSYEKAENLSEFNSFLLSRVLNSIWGLNLVIIPLSKVTSVLRPAYEYLLPNYPKMVDASNLVTARLEREGFEIKRNLILKPSVLPLWYLCPGCNGRVHLLIIPDKRLLVEGICPGCQHKFKFDLGSKDCPDLEPIQSEMAPTVILDELTDIVGWKMMGGLSLRW